MKHFPHDTHHTNSIISKKLYDILSLHSVGMDFRLKHSPYNELLKNLGNPQDHLPPTIHIAGTNGKGSTLAFIRSIYEAAGYKVHAYTSPHIHSFNERIYLAGKMINDNDLLYYLDQIEIANAGKPVTFFEYTTALAFKAMADKPADICLLETGLGGRLDSTNIIKNPIATVITAIGYDHMDYLGNTIESIAAEKAGIFKQSAKAVIAPQKYKDTLKIFEKKFSAIGGKEICYVSNINDLPTLGLIGDYQKENASTAKMLIQSLQTKFPVSNADIKTGLKNVTWPARLEKIKTKALTNLLSKESEIWFDCGHNPDGADMLAKQIKKWKIDYPNHDFHLILGLATDKDTDAFTKPLRSLVSKIHCVDLLNARNPQNGHDLAKKIGTDKYYDYVHSALKALPQDKSVFALITGSLYLYGDIV